MNTFISNIFMWYTNLNDTVSPFSNGKQTQMFSLQFTAAAIDNAKMQVLLPHCSPANLEEALPGEVCWRLGAEYGDASRQGNQPTNQPANQRTRTRTRTLIDESERCWPIGTVLTELIMRNLILIYPLVNRKMYSEVVNIHLSSPSS